MGPISIAYDNGRVAFSCQSNHHVRYHPGSDASDGDSSPDAEPKGEPVLDVRPAGYKQTVQRLRMANTEAQRRRQALSLRGTGSPPASPAKSAKKRAVARDSNGRLKVCIMCSCGVGVRRYGV